MQTGSPRHARFPTKSDTSESDFCNSILAVDPSSSRAANTLPVLNSWTHTVPLATLISLVGIEFHPGLIIIRPQLQLQTYTIETALIGVKNLVKDCAMHYHPDRPGKFTFHVYLPHEDYVQCKRIAINGRKSEKMESYVVEDGSDFLAQRKRYVHLSS